MASGPPTMDIGRSSAKFCLPWTKNLAKPPLVGKFFCWNSTFHFLAASPGYFLPLFATTNRFRPHTRSAYETTFESCHSTITLAAHYRSFWNKEHTLPVRIVLSSEYSRSSNFISCNLKLILNVCIGPISFSRHVLQHTNNWRSVDSSTFLWRECVTLNATS